MDLEFEKALRDTLWEMHCVTLETVLRLVDQIIAMPVKRVRGGQPPKHVQIRQAIAVLAERNHVGE